MLHTDIYERLTCQDRFHDIRRKRVQLQHSSDDKLLDFLYGQRQGRAFSIACFGLLQASVVAVFAAVVLGPWRLSQAAALNIAQHRCLVETYNYRSSKCESKRDLCMNTPVSRVRIAVGWFAVLLTTVAACFWSFWGIIENFHEGWYHRTLLMNLAMMLGQYLLPMMIFVSAGSIAVRRPIAGGVLHLIAAGWAAWHFRGAAVLVVYVSIVGPLVLMAFGYWWGRPQPRSWAIATIIALPVLTILICGAEPAWRVSTRWQDNHFGMRLIEGNGVRLEWAPAGPGWPDHGVSWIEAERICRFLKDDGLELADSPQDIWRLPTVEEVVKSSCRHGRNAGGVWNAKTQNADFDITPDKEPPLWNSHSKIIYWWTGSESDPDQAQRICYNGHVMPLPKKIDYGYLGFRAVKTPASVNVPKSAE